MKAGDVHLKVEGLFIELALPHKKNLVSDLSFNLYSGQTTALVGESGSGKSISALSILKLLPPSMSVRGKILLQDQDILKMSDEQVRRVRGKQVAIIFQEPMTALNPLHTIDRQISECFAESLNASDKESEILKLLELVQIPNPRDKLKAYPHQLSGGQRQRVMIAMALANKPDILIADEPTTALDVTVQKDILELLESLKQKLSLSILLITHDIHIVKKYSQHMVIMQAGQSVESGTTSKIFEHPNSSYTQSLIKSTTVSTPGSYSNELVLSTKGIDCSFDLPKTKLFTRDTIQILHDVSFSLHKGEILGLIGESGSGKTTIAYVLLKLVQADGYYDLLGHEVLNLSQKQFLKFRKHIQIVFQDPYASLSPRMTVKGIISEGIAEHSDLSDSEITTKVEKTLELVGLDSSILQRYPHEFSGGQRQRIAIARALIMEPSCIILDEPTSALDRNIQEQILELIVDLQKRLSISFLLITHDLQLVSHICHNVLILKDGRIVDSGNTQDIYHNSKNAYTRSLLDAYPGDLT